MNCLRRALEHKTQPRISPILRMTRLWNVRVTPSSRPLRHNLPPVQDTTEPHCDPVLRTPSPRASAMPIGHDHQHPKLWNQPPRGCHCAPVPPETNDLGDFPYGATEKFLLV
ncbi:uncharacterized protein WM277_001810 [Molossus nigricans]